MQSSKPRAWHASHRKGCLHRVPTNWPCRTHNITSSVVAHANLRIRQCQLEDVNQVASVCAEVFGQGLFPGVAHPHLDAVEQRYASAVSREVKGSVETALLKKAQAASTAREYRLRRHTMMLRAQLAVLRGQHAVFPTQPSPEEKRQLAKWLRARQYVVLVAEDTDTRQIVGTASLSLFQPEAILPPPWPTTAPLRPYVSNMAVLEKWRRMGVARSMLRQCMRLAGLWGYPMLWLHVHQSKTGAMRLYQQEGFSRAPPGPLPTLMAMKGEVLLCRALPTQTVRQQRTSQSGTSSRHMIEAAAEAALGSSSPGLE